jgi:hypothetical protein
MESKHGIYTTVWLKGRFNAVLAVVVCLVRIKSTHFSLSTNIFSFLFLALEIN